jgi:hypothetical protein
VVKQDRLKSASEEDDNDHGEIKAQWDIIAYMNITLTLLVY